MGKLVLFFFSLAVAFIGGYEAARWNPFRGYGLEAEERVLGNSFQPDPYSLKNRQFVALIVGHNNGAYVQKTLDSVFRQNYEHFRVVYIDDGSSDGSFELARDLIYSGDFPGEASFVRNEERIGILANLARVIETCLDEEIVVVLEGEDWLAHEWVLQRLNAYYANPDLWMTHGQWREFPGYGLGQTGPLTETDWKEKGFRGQNFVPGPLRSFYAGLFKKIKENDLIYQGKFFPVCGDLAYMLPMLEMAKDHFQFISETLYIANGAVEKKQEGELRAKCERFIRSSTPYPALAGLELRQPEESP